jgi:hypothetical protein
MSSVITSNVTSGFIDLATFDEIEKYMYGGPDATAYFVRETRKSTWFTQVPVALSRASGVPAFGQDWSASISRAGDYLLQTWLRLTISSVQNLETTTDALVWTRNLGHNLIKECSVTFNDLVAARFDSYFLDFWAAFTVPASKRTGYDTMIGNVSELIQPPQTIPYTLPSYILNIPLPFFYSRDSGVALPTAALPYNDMKINFSFRDWTELLVHFPSLGSQCVPATLSNIASGVAPTITNCNVWANYAIVSNDERKRMACAPRDILIEQVQTAPRQTFAPLSNPEPSYDIRFSHAVKVLFFAVRNKTCSSEWSNYKTISPVFYNDFATNTNAISYYSTATVATQDPIETTSLIYENTSRLASMGSDYYTLINPYYNAPVVPWTFANVCTGDITGAIGTPNTYFTFTVDIGYHSYSYSLDFNCLDPMGSTNYGKLTNVSIVPKASNAAVTASAAGTGFYLNQKYDFILTSVNNNIIRISGGALGFPVL